MAGTTLPAQFQSALPLRGATSRRLALLPYWSISIRAPLAGSDVASGGAAAAEAISIRAPLAGSDQAAGSGFGGYDDFNPRSPCGERPPSQCCRFPSTIFQSALPLRGATAIFCSITLLSAKYCSFKDRRRKFIRQIPQNSSRTRYNVVRTSLVEHDRLWFATS